MMTKNKQTSFEKVLSQYDYNFPPELIAQKPTSPRDSAKLLVYNKSTKEVCFDVFSNLPKHLPKNSVLVLNKTKVVPARLELTKTTGGKVQTLYVETTGNHILVLANKKLDAGQKLKLNNKIEFTVAKHVGNKYALTPSFPISGLFTVLEKYGQTPIPPYIKHSPLTKAKLRTEYQTVFAKTRGSVAAPTASLHFTKKLLSQLQRAGINIKYVTLHVNLGTFASLTEEQLKNKTLHSEYYEIDEATARFLNKAKENDRQIIATGTTVVRTLESAINNKSRLTKLSGNTTLFIDESYKLRFCDNLITNFHVPKSSLLMLVSAFIGRKKLLALYQQAIAKKFRLFSFGDGMLIK